MSDYKEIKCYKDEKAEKEISKMEKIIITRKFEESYIRNLVCIYTILLYSQNNDSILYEK